jgi:DNA repair protein RadC
MARKFLLVDARDVWDESLVAVLLAGSVEGSPEEAARALLADVQGNLARVARAEGFANRKGFSVLAQARMVAAAELVKRAERRAAVEGKGGQIIDPDAAERIARAYIGGPREQVGALFFDNQMRLLGFRILSMGGQSMTVADPREVVIAALEMRAHAVILVHNHPSGVAKPSSEDDVTTARLKEILRLLGMTLADHIILGKDVDTYSYAMTARLNPRRNPPLGTMMENFKELLTRPRADRVLAEGVLPDGKPYRLTQQNGNHYRDILDILRLKVGSRNVAAVAGDMGDSLFIEHNTYTLPEARGKGYMRMVYGLLLDRGIGVRSDQWNHSLPMRRVWMALARTGFVFVEETEKSPGGFYTPTGNFLRVRGDDVNDPLLDATLFAAPGSTLEDAEEAMVSMIDEDFHLSS